MLCCSPSWHHLAQPLPFLLSQLQFCSRRRRSSCEQVGFRSLIFSLCWESLKINSLVLSQLLRLILAAGRAAAALTLLLSSVRSWAVRGNPAWPQAEGRTLPANPWSWGCHRYGVLGAGAGIGAMAPAGTGVPRAGKLPLNYSWIRRCSEWPPKTCQHGTGRCVATCPRGTHVCAPRASGCWRSVQVHVPLPVPSPPVSCP